MRCAPSVTYPVGRSPFLGRLVLALGVGSFGVLMLWGWHASAFLHWPWWVAASAWIGWAVWARHAWRAEHRDALLEWDALAPPLAGENGPGAWFWYPDNVAAGDVLTGVKVVADWQRGMLLHLSDERGARTWVWAEERRDPVRWLDFRRAIVFSGNA